jgi:ferredoxin
MMHFGDHWNIQNLQPPIPMADLSNRVSRNVPGTFYNDDTCTDCDLCREIAPGIFRRDDELAQSYVWRQPETPEERALAQEAMGACPSESIGDDGAP